MSINNIRLCEKVHNNFCKMASSEERDEDKNLERSVECCLYRARMREKSRANHGKWWHLFKVDVVSIYHVFEFFIILNSFSTET